MNNFDGINHYANNNPIIPSPIRKRKRRIWKWILVILIILGGTAAYFGSTILSRANQIFTNNTSIFTRFKQLMVSEDKPLQGEEAGMSIWTTSSCCVSTRPGLHAQ